MDQKVLADQIEQAKAAHESWKGKLQAAVETGALPKPAKDISCDDQCSFGKWLHGLKDDTGVKMSLGFRKVMTSHAEFHQIAGDIASCIEAGDKFGAQTRLNGTRFAEKTQELQAAMTAWQRGLH